MNKDKITSTPSPIQFLTELNGIFVYIKRDDLLAPSPGDPFCGNKWRKLKYNLLDLQRSEYRKILTFGGPFSNHIAAVASAGKHLRFQTIGIIRGERHLPLNPTLRFAADCGMQLEYLDRSSYRAYTRMDIPRDLLDRFGPCFILPEGGSNHRALPGCAEMATEIHTQLSEWPAAIGISCGTGGTMAGLINGTDNNCRVIGVSALRGDFHQRDIQTMVPKNLTNWEVKTEYHFGGYAKFNDVLIQFINDFRTQYRIQLDPIYTGKLFYGVFDLIRQGYFRNSDKVVLVHSGGLQGIKGFNQRFGGVLNVGEKWMSE